MPSPTVGGAGVPGMPVSPASLRRGSLEPWGRLLPAHGHRTSGGQSVIREASIPTAGLVGRVKRLTDQTDRQMSALRTGWERQPWVENNLVPAGLLGFLQENKLIALRAQRGERR